jgi:hypothetical protein
MFVPPVCFSAAAASTARRAALASLPAGGWEPSTKVNESKSQVKRSQELHGSNTLYTLATLGAYLPGAHCIHWLRLESTHLLYYTVYTGYTWSLLTYILYYTVYTGYTWSPLTYCTTLYTLATLGVYLTGARENGVQYYLY